MGVSVLCCLHGLQVDVSWQLYLTHANPARAKHLPSQRMNIKGQRNERSGSNVEVKVNNHWKHCCKDAWILHNPTGRVQPVLICHCTLSVFCMLTYFLTYFPVI